MIASSHENQPKGRLINAIRRGTGGTLTYGVTPPKRSWTTERVLEVAEKQTRRLQRMPIDAVIVYDLQDETGRTDATRPFPFMRCVDPATYAFEHLAEVGATKVVYRCVSEDTEESLEHGLRRIDVAGGLAVLVGAPSRDRPVSMRLNQAYAHRRATCGGLLIGGVTIAERHRRNRTEHERVIAKVDSGCSFLVSQAVYSSEATKDLLSDLVALCDREGRSVPPIWVTLTPCGSEKTLSFIKWLGIHVPPWQENELLKSKDALSTSIDLLTDVFEELYAFATARGIPLGCNVESVSLRGDEIDASVELLQRVAGILSCTRSGRE